MRYESGTNYIFLILQMLVKCCFLEAITKYCGSSIEPHHLCDHLGNQIFVLLLSAKSQAPVILLLSLLKNVYVCVFLFSS